MRLIVMIEADPSSLNHANHNSIPSHFQIAITYHI